VIVLLATRRGSDRLRRFLDTVGAPTAANAPSAWSGHVIVCGLEGVGLRTVEQLLGAGVALVVVDDDAAAPHAPTVESLGVPYIPAGGSLEGQLRRAGLPGARAVVCTSDSDLRNVETALVARDLRADIDVVAHLDNPTVGRAVEEATGSGSALDVAGLFAPAVVDACMYRRATTWTSAASASSPQRSASAARARCASSSATSSRSGWCGPTASWSSARGATSASLPATG
jgi:hypothetical protein